jgi:hypothetical protein
MLQDVPEGANPAKAISDTKRMMAERGCAAGPYRNYAPRE